MDLVNTASPIKYSGIAKISPNNELLALINTFKLKILSISSKPYVSKAEFKYKDVVSVIEWSYNSEYILVGLFAYHLVIVQSLNSYNLSYKVDEGLFGISAAFFLPKNTNQIFTINSFSTRLTIWSLNEKTSHFITSPKYPSRDILTFSPTGAYMALAQSREEGDTIGIFALKDWSILLNFSVSASDLKKIEWSYDGEYILVLDTEIECRLFFYSPKSGDLIKCLQPYSDKMGIRDFKYSSNASFISLACMNGSSYVYYSNGDFIEEFDHCRTFVDGSVYILKEEIIYPRKGRFAISIFVKVEVPYKLEPSPESDPVRDDVITFIEWSGNSMFLCTVNGLNPNVLWVWNIQNLSLVTVIIFDTRITQMKANHKNYLMILNESPRIFLYDFDKGVINGYNTGLNVCPKVVEFDEEGEKFIVGNGIELLVCSINQNEKQQQLTTSSFKNYSPSGNIMGNTGSRFMDNESGSISGFINPKK